MMSGLSFVVSAARDDFSNRDLALAKAVGPHIMRAVETSRRIGVLEGRLRLTETLLDAAAEPVALVDADARLIHANLGAHALFASADGLLLRRAIVGCADHQETARLHGCIRVAALGRPPRAETLGVRRPSGGRPYVILVTPMPTGLAAEAAGQRAVAIFMGNPDTVITERATALRTAYGLTASEALLVDLLVREDLRLGEVAEQLGITLSTAKSQLHRAFVKTGVRSQNELVRLVLLGLPNGRMP